VVIEGAVDEAARPPTNREPYPLQRRIIGDATVTGATPRILIGIYDLFYHGHYSTAAVADADSELYQIDAAGIDWLIARAPEIGELLAPFALIERLRTIPLLAKVTPVALGFLADECNRRPRQYCVPNEVIYQESARAHLIYLIDRGQVYLEWSDDHTRWLGNGATFGLFDEPTLNDETLDHRAVATKETALLQIPRAAFRRITGINADERGKEAYQSLASAVDEVPLFINLNPDVQHRLLGYFSHYYLPNPHVLVQQGEINDSLWLLLPGSGAQVHGLKSSGEAYQRVSAKGPAYFGENALYAEAPMGATIEGEEESQWARLHRDDLVQAVRDLGDNLGAKLPQLQTTTVTPFRSRFPSYPWLQAGETIRLICHRHWIDLLRKFSPSLGLFIALLILTLAVAGGALNPAGWVYAVVIGGGVVMLGQVIWALVDYLNDFLIVTNRRLVLQEEILFFRRWRRETALDRVQNIDIRISFWGKVFGYGNIVVRTAAEQGSLPFAFVAEPKLIEQTITELRALRKIDEDARKRSSVQHLLTGRLRLRLPLPPRVCLPAAEAPPAESLWRTLRRLIKELLLWRSATPSDSQHVVWRKHWLILLGRLLRALAIPGLILLFVVWQAFAGPTAASNAVVALELILGLLLFADLLWIAWIVADWRNDTYEVTTNSIMDVEKKPLFFDEKRRMARLDEIENIEVNVPSFLHYLFDFGSVRLQTASSDGNFTFDLVPHPHAVAAEVQRRIEEYQTRERMIAAQRRAQELPDWFDLYDLLGGVGKRHARRPLP
jgi:CRP-like cAMP-binding protein/membrane protein YdbS with pleckstrin-like domain